MRTALVCVRTRVAAQRITACATKLGVTTIQTAISETEALARLEEHPAELVLADTALTRPDTAGFTRRVLALAPDAVLLLFGPEEPLVARAAVAAGARGLIPAQDHDPVATVTKALLLLGAPRRLPAGDPAVRANGAGRIVAAPARAGSGASGPTGRSGSTGPGGSAGPGGPAGLPGPASLPGPAGPGRGGGGVPAPGRAPTVPLAAPRARPLPGLAGSAAANGSLLVVPAQRGDPPVAPAGDPARRASLTERELQVLRGMSEGKSNAEIGRDLFVSEDTVKTHARRLFRKLRVRDRAHAVAVGFRGGALQ